MDKNNTASNATLSLVKPSFENVTDYHRFSKNKDTNREALNADDLLKEQHSAHENFYEKYFMKGNSFSNKSIYIVLSVLLLASFVVSYLNTVQYHEHKQEIFSQDVIKIRQRLNDKIQTYFSLLQGYEGLFSASTYVDPKEWDTYSTAMLNMRGYEEVKFVDFIKNVPHSELNQFIEQSRNELSQDFTLFPFKASDNYFVYKYHYGSPSQFKIGQDLNHTADIASDLRFSRNTGQNTFSKIHQENVQGISKYYMYFMMPVYKKNTLHKTTEEKIESIYGWVMAKVALEGTFNKILENDLHFAIRERSESGTTYQFMTAPTLDKATYSEHLLIDVGGKKWDFVIFLDKQLPAIPYSTWIYLTLGLLISFFASGLLWSISTTQRRAHNIANSISFDLRKSELKNRSTVENIPGVIYRCKPGLNWNMEYISDAIKNLSGYTSDELMHNSPITYSSIIHPDDLTKVEEIIGLKPTSGHTHNFEYRIIHKDGSIRWVYERGLVIEDVYTAEPILTGAVFDITDRKQKERELSQLTLALENAVEGIGFIGLNKQFSSVNEAFAQMFDAKPIMLHGENWLSIIHSDDHENAEDAYNKMLDGAHPSINVHGYSSVNDSLHLNITLVPSYTEGEDPEFLGTYCFVKDISERIKRETQLAKAFTDAEKANKTKSMFLATMSHELRTPLNAIIGYSEIIYEEIEEEGLNGLLKDIKKINNAGRHLLELINDILDVSKLEAGKVTVHLEAFDCHEMCQSIIDLMVPSAEKNENNLSLSCPKDLGDMFSDFTKVRQALFNLMSNACKFTKKGNVSLNVSEIRRSGIEFVQFTVQDSGCGITEEQLAKLFQPFTQADSSTTRKYGGTGLGLTITKRFVELLGGDVVVKSRIGKGSAFIITLPRESKNHKKTTLQEGELRRVS